MDDKSRGENKNGLIYVGAERLVRFCKFYNCSNECLIKKKFPKLCENENLSYRTLTHALLTLQNFMKTDFTMLKINPNIDYSKVFSDERDVEIKWDELKIDSKLNIIDRFGFQKKYYYAGLRDGIPYAWKDGKTSWSVDSQNDDIFRIDEQSEYMVRLDE